MRSVAVNRLRGMRRALRRWCASLLLALQRPTLRTQPFGRPDLHHRRKRLDTLGSLPPRTLRLAHDDLLCTMNLAGHALLHCALDCPPHIADPSRVRAHELLVGALSRSLINRSNN